MLRELGKNGLSVQNLRELSYKSKMGRSLVNSLRKFDRVEMFKELCEMIRFYQEADILDLVDLDYRIKSEDSCIRKYNKFYPDMRLEKVFNDILGFRMLTDNYKSLLEGEIPEEVRVVDMSHGKANDDGYRGVHIYFQPDHSYYPIEIQANFSIIPGWASGSWLCFSMASSMAPRVAMPAVDTLTSRRSLFVIVKTA